MFRFPPQPMWDLTIHPSSGPSVLADTRSLLQSMWDSSIHPPSGPASLLAHRLMSTPFRAQPPCWHIVRCLALIQFEWSKSTASRYCPLLVFSSGLPLKVFKTRLLRRGFHTLIKDTPFPSPTDVGSHNPPPSGSSVHAGTRSLFQSMWDPPIYHPSEPSVFVGTPLRVHPPSELSLLAGTSPGI